VKLSSDRLLQEANATGFRPESLEKVIRLVGLLNAIFRHPELASRLALKGGTTLKDLRVVHAGGTTVDEQDFRKSVEPLLRVRGTDLNLGAMQDACRSGLARLLPIRSSEAAFLDALWERGEIRPEYLTEDHDTQGRIQSMPMLLWKAQHVRQHKGISAPSKGKQGPFLP